jgi:hypothetical protein
MPGAFTGLIQESQEEKYRLLGCDGVCPVRADVSEKRIASIHTVSSQKTAFLKNHQVSGLCPLSEILST